MPTACVCCPQLSLGCLPSAILETAQIVRLLKVVDVLLYGNACGRVDGDKPQCHHQSFKQSDCGLPSGSTPVRGPQQLRYYGCYSHGKAQETANQNRFQLQSWSKDLKTLCYARYYLVVVGFCGSLGISQQGLSSQGQGQWLFTNWYGGIYYFNNRCALLVNLAKDQSCAFFY